MAIPMLSTVEDVLRILSGGAGVAGEATDEVDLLDHALQAAYEAYVLRPNDEELQVAALVHDLGHLLPQGAHPSRVAVDHGWLGAAAVRGLLGRRVGDLIGQHVTAARYRATVEPLVWSAWSEARRASILRHGGLLSPAQVRKFERQWNLTDALLLCEADERAGEARRVVPGLLSWLPALQSVALAARHEREILLTSIVTTPLAM